VVWLQSTLGADMPLTRKITECCLYAALSMSGQISYAELKAAPLQVISAPALFAQSQAPSPANTSTPDTNPPVDCETASDSEAELGAIGRASKNKRAARLDTALVAQARTGDASAAWRAALATFRGDCAASNYGQALGFIQIAAQAGHACATGAWGLMLVRGWGVSRDLPQARDLLERSAQAGCKRSYYWSWLADELAARPQTRERALAKLMQGADLGDGHALNALAVVREIDGQRDDARKLYLRAANAGNATARTNLARLARFFSQSTEKPTVASLSQRAEAGEPQAQYLLARRLHQGDGTSVNFVQALKWYQLSAQKGNPAAREMLALLQARLANGTAPATVLANLSMVEVNSDELNKKRGVTQPIEDTDPFAGI
jgi:uncharacterized protein